MDYNQQSEIRNLSALRRFSSVKKVGRIHDDGGNVTATYFSCTNRNIIAPFFIKCHTHVDERGFEQERSDR